MIVQGYTGDGRQVQQGHGGTHIETLQQRDQRRADERAKLRAATADELTAALELVYLSMARRTPAGITLSVWAEAVLANPATEGQKWDAEAAKAVCDVLRKVGSGVVL